MGLLLRKRHKRWTNNKPTLVQYIVFVDAYQTKRCQFITDSTMTSVFSVFQTRLFIKNQVMLRMWIYTILFFLCQRGNLFEEPSHVSFICNPYRLLGDGSCRIIPTSKKTSLWSDCAEISDNEWTDYECICVKITLH